MSIGKVWISDKVVPLFQKLQDKLNGFPPFINVYSDVLPRGPASLHQPTLYPQINIPAEKDGNWGEVARGIVHLLSALDGVPELRVAGQDIDPRIAVDLNGELQNIAAAKEAVQPLPQWTPDAPNKLLEMILNPTPETLVAHTDFALIQLHRLVMDGHPEAQAALTEVQEKLPDKTKAVKATFESIISEDLRTPAGKALAAAKLLKFLNFDENSFYLQRSQHIFGIYDDRSLGYYPVIEALRADFEVLRPSPAVWLKFLLPFALPILEGIYQTENLTMFVQHVRISNPRAGWKASQGARVDSMMNPSGLYAQSLIELWLPGEISISFTQPPGDVYYKNVDTYPEVLRVATIRLNEFIAGLRSQTGRSDIPEMLPSDLNQLAYKQFDASGNVVRNVPSTNFEMVRMSMGAPALKGEVQREVHNVKRLSFASELLESAKFQVSAYNTRRAVLDLAGAFEAFIAESITPRIGDLSLNIRDQFLRQYNTKLSTKVREEIEKIMIGSGDPSRMPTVHRQLKEYSRLNLEPVINQKNISKVLKIMSGVRNDAAHGRPVSPSKLNDIVLAIEALDALIRDQSASG